jgi:hypothetical protein
MNLMRAKFQIVGVVLALVAFCAIAAQAQSGRRQPRTAPAAPVPTPTPEPTPEPKKQDKDSDLGFIIAADRYTNMNSYPWSYFDAVMVGCAGRLRSGSSATVDIAQQDMNRSDAIKKAKGETTTYVVLIKLKLDDMASSYDDLEVEFTVFAPKTGKIVVFGTAYQNANQSGPIITRPNSRGRSGPLYREELLKRAGEDMGDRILKTLNLGGAPILH